MKFDIRVWYEYRKLAHAVGDHINSFKDHRGFIRIEKEELEGYVQQITDILKECSEYMDKCGIKMPIPLWEYHDKKPRTHASNKDFIYKSYMSKKAINAYGKAFMTSPLEKKIA